ncbi:hypothetical protein Afe04nite_64310 [Asanoa ferruginea]|nr:hypothetical protein Afe04nite_64310 [Asanoa ferruginea]
MVATSDYQDTELRRLRAPAQDAAELVEVLGDATIGGFTVTPVLDGTKRDVEIALETFLTACRPDDFALVYLSCHGLLDARGQLWFAAGDTFKNLLGATAVEAQWLQKRLENCRATRQIVLLDCCFSGAYVKGGKGAADVGVETLHGGGRGHVVLTASRATEYSYEGEPVDGGALAGSVFTTALVHGLRTGEADLDNDGVITTDEAYDYVNGYLRAVGANQTPTHTVVGGVGRIQLARSPVGVRPVVVPAQSTVQVVAEAAEIMAVAPAPVAASGPAPVIPVDGPAGELATLRAIRRVLDDPAALETVLRERPVADVVKVIAAVRATGLAGRAADVLRVAAAVRPVDDIGALVGATRGGSHPADADVLLAAIGTSRQLTDVVRLCSDPERLDVGADIVLGLAARTRPVTEVRPLARLLPLERGQYVLHEFGKVRSGAEIAELFAGASSAAVLSVLDGVRRRPAAEFGVVVKALRDAGDDVTADRVLGWVDALPVGEIVELVDGLRAAGAGDDADTVLQWAGWRLRPPLVAALIAALHAAGHTESVGAVVRAAESRPLDDLYEMLRAAVSTHADHSGPVLELAARRSPDELATLLKRLEPTGSRGFVEARTRTANALVATVAQPNEIERLLALMQAAGSAPVVARLATTVAAAPVETVNRFVRGLVDAGHTDAATGMIREAADRPWGEIANLVAALATDPPEALVEVLVTATARFPQDKLSAVLAGLYRVNAMTIVDHFLHAVPVVRWHQVAPVAGQTPGYAIRMHELRNRAAAAWRSGRRKAFLRWVAVGTGIVALAAATLFLAASVTRVFGDTRFGAGDWAAWGITTLIAGLFIWGIVAIIVNVTEGSDGEVIGVVTVWVTLAAAVAGVVLGRLAPPIAAAATHVRDWLAWNF